MNLFGDMAAQTHFLIAGASGSGKSVVENGFINYIVNNYTDNAAGIILIDPKMVELYRWRNVPHCMDYADNLADIARVLRNVEDFMIKRLDWLRSINELKWRGSVAYVFIDELADIGADRECREVLSRLARLSRAAGIHIIACTQRPSISDRLMPAELRTNLDSRLCLRVSEAKDSRMVIGRSGAETLPRHGQGYILTPDRMKPEIVNVPFVTEGEITATINRNRK